MKKILIIRTSLHGGGAERVIVELSDNLILQGYEVDIFLWENKIDYALNKDINIILSQMPSLYRKINNFSLKLFGNLSYLFLSPLFIIDLYKNIKINEYDKIYIHSLISILQFTYLRNKRAYNVFHSFKSELMLKNRNFISSLKNKLMIYIAGNLKKNIAVSSGIAKDLEKNFGITNVITIYNPFNIDLILKLSNKNEHDLKKYGKFILNIGRLDKIKNQKEIIIAFSRCTNIYDTLIILGDGSEKNNLKELVNDLNLENKVFLLGFQNNPYEFIKKAAVVVSCSIIEGFGNTVVESLIIKTPVISSNCPCGPKEIMTGKLSNYLYKINHPDELYNLLVNLNINKYPFSSFDKSIFDTNLISKKYIDIQ